MRKESLNKAAAILLALSAVLSLTLTAFIYMDGEWPVPTMHSEALTASVILSALIIAFTVMFILVVRTENVPERKRAKDGTYLVPVSHDVNEGVPDAKETRGKLPPDFQ